MPETKVILENLDRDFQTYRDELDELVKAMATSSAVAEIDAKLDRINAAMDANSEALEAQRVNQAAKNLQLQSSLSVRRRWQGSVTVATPNASSKRGNSLLGPRTSLCVTYRPAL